jgi:hypothetical protein
VLDFPTRHIGLPDGISNSWCVCMYGLDGWMYVCLYVCMYVCIYVYIKISLYYYICTQVFRYISLRCMGLYAQWMCGALLIMDK